MRDVRQAFGSIDESMGVTTAGAALFWAWVDCFLFTPSLFQTSSASAHFFLVAFVIAVCAGCATMACCLPLASRLRTSLFSRRGPVACAVIAAIGGTAVVAGARLAILPLVIAGSLANGYVFGAGVLYWGCAYAVKGARSACVLAPCSFSAAAFFCVLLEVLFNVPAMPFVVVLLPAASFFVYTRAESRAVRCASSAIRGPEGSRDAVDAAVTFEKSEGTGLGSPDRTAPASDQPRYANGLFARFGLTVNAVIGFGVFGLAFGFMQYSTIFSVESIDPSSSLQLLVVRGAAAAILALCSLFAVEKTHVVYRIGMAVMIAGFMIMPFTMSEDASTIPASLIIVAGYTAFDVMSWTILCETAFFRRHPAVSLVGFGRTLVHGGVALGAILGAVVSFVPLSAVNSAIMVTSVGYLLVVAVILLIGDTGGIWMLLRYGTMFDQSDEKNGADRASSLAESDQRVAFAMIATRYGLTTREQEVMELFGIGRSTAFIAQQLCISESTAKSHVRHIYAKCGIHNRQELLDLLESPDA